tara:strand:+ start:52932 stop:53567 length:636 start_codon:yes stop_codon:yes gene_type:complete
MKKYLSFILTLLLLGTLSINAANEGTILVPEDDGSDILLVNDSQEASSEEVVSDLELVDEFDVQNNSPLTFTTQASASIMTLEVRQSVGVNVLRDRLELGVDVAALLVMAGSGAVVGSVGAYAKLYIIPTQRGRYYIKGRAYRAYGFSDNLDEIQMEYGFGRENADGGFLELTIKDFQNKDGDRFMFPFISFGQKFGKKSKKKEEIIDLNE